MATDEVSVDLSIDDCALLIAGLRAYIDKFERHRLEDGGRTHPESQLREVQSNANRVEQKLLFAINNRPPGSRES